MSGILVELRTIIEFNAKTLFYEFLDKFCTISLNIDALAESRNRNIEPAQLAPVGTDQQAHVLFELRISFRIPENETTVKAALLIEMSSLDVFDFVFDFRSAQEKANLGFDLLDAAFHFIDSLLGSRFLNIVQQLRDYAIRVQMLA